MQPVSRMAAAILLLLLAGQCFVAYGQAGRATLTGVVSDSSGAVVAQATVTVINVNTGGRYPATTNDVGSYTVPALPVGEYSLKVELQGFKEFNRTGIRLSTDQVARVDVKLEIGSTAEAVEVRADVQMLATESATVTTNMDTRAFSSLPLTFAEGRNMAVFADKLIPGWDGARHDSRVNGTPAGGQTVLIDGQNNLTGFLSGDFAEQSISPEAVQEMTVTVGAQTAETGRASGGVLQFTLKSGTNQLHGSGLYQLRNEILNANHWGRNLLYYNDPIKNADKGRDRERRFNYGGSVGGPVYIPGVYDGRNKSFFHVTAEKFNYGINGATGNWNRTVPLPAFLQGDFSSLLTGASRGTDVLGRSVPEGGIFDPATLRQVNNVWVMDQFVNNRIPVSRFSSSAQTMVGIYEKYYPAMRDQMANNYLQSAYWRQTVRQGTIKGDHYISPYHKVSGYYNWMAQPRTTSDQGLWTAADWETGGPFSAYIKQNRNGYNISVAYDWTISPTLLNSFRYGYNNGKNFYGSFNQTYDGKPVEEVWGMKGLARNPDIPAGQGPMPWANFAGSFRWTPTALGHRSAGQKDYTNTIISDTVNWQRGKHVLKFGFELNRMHQIMEDYSWWGLQMTFSPRQTAQPLVSSNNGHAFASFLLGEVNAASMAQPLTLYPFMYYMAGFVQDSWKVNQRLTLNLGLRWNGGSPVYERDDKQANFNLNLIDPISGLPGAVEYMGSGQGRAGRRTPVSGSWGMFGPSLGFAYSATNRILVRGGYALTYEPMSFRFGTVPFSSPLQGRMNAVQDSRGPYVGAYNLDQGFPNSGWSVVNYSPSWANIRGNSPTWVSPDAPKSAYIQHANFGLQTEITSNLMVEGDWRFTKGTRLNGQSMVLKNQARVEDLQRFTPAVLDATYSTPEAAVAVGLPFTFPGWSGRGYEALRPYPQLTQNGIGTFGDRVGFSTYHSGNLIVTKRMSQGVYAYGAYTFSKTITNVSSVDGAHTGFTDTYNLTLYKSISPTDRTHVIKSAMVWELPVGQGRRFLSVTNPVLSHLISGWTVSTTIGYSSGTPLGTVGGLNQFLGWNGGSRTQNFDTPAGGFNRVFNPATFDPWNPNAAGNRFFDTSAFSTPADQQLGNAPLRFPQVRLPWRFSEDASLIKRFSVKERARLEFRLEMLNVFNRHYFANPQMAANNAAFGNIPGVDGSDPRKGQAGLRVQW